MRLFLFLSLMGLVLAQDFPCAGLLNNLPSSSLQGISTLEATLTIRYVENGNEVQYALAKDFENGRTYHTFSEKLGEDFVTSAVYRYQNGAGTLTRGDKTEEAPPEDSIEGIGEMMELLEFDLRDIFAKDGVQSCDGQKTYGSFTGQQATVSADGEETFLLFDDTGQLFAFASYYSGGELVLGVLDEFVIEDRRFQRGKVSTYEIQGEAAVLREERWLEVQSYNKPLSESLFEN